MNSHILIALVLIPSFLLGALLSTASAGPMGVARGGQLDSLSPRIQEAESRSSLDLQLVWHHRDPSYDSMGILVDDEIYIVQFEGDSERGSVSLYDGRGNIIVAYAGTAEGVAVFDMDGFVELTTGRSRVNSLSSYGPEVQVLTNPAVLIEFLDIYDVVSGDEPAGHPLAWAAAAFIARCIDVSATFNGSGDLEQVTVAWDC